MTKLPVVAAVAAAFALSACDVEQTREAELPEVDVSGGQMPAYDVDTADIEIGTGERTIEVPTVDIEAPNAGNAAD